MNLHSNNFPNLTATEDLMHAHINKAYLPLVIFLWILMPTASCFAQTSRQDTHPLVRRLESPSATPVRDTQAVVALQKSIAALGGPQAISGIQSYIIHGIIDADASGWDKGGTVTWKVSGGEFRIDATTSDGVSTFLTGHGKPARILNGTATRSRVYVAHSLFVPVLVAATLLRELQTDSYSLEFGGTQPLGSASALVVKTSLRTTHSDALATPQVWYIDNVTNLPIRVEFRYPDSVDPTHFTVAAADFTNYSGTNGILYPKQVTMSHEGKRDAVITIEELNVNLDISPSDFDAPTGGGQ